VGAAPKEAPLLDNPMLLAILPLGGWELAVIIIVGMVLFYGKRLPEIGRNMGRSIVEFKKGLANAGEDEKKPSGEAQKPKQESGTQS
jgi:sec-independent protein translocase protein TatA